MIIKFKERDCFSQSTDFDVRLQELVNHLPRDSVSLCRVEWNRDSKRAEWSSTKIRPGVDWRRLLCMFFGPLLLAIK